MISAKPKHKDEHSDDQFRVPFVSFIKKNSGVQKETFVWNLNCVFNSSKFFERLVLKDLNGGMQDFVRKC